jgi:hypothetical protein
MQVIGRRDRIDFPEFKLFNIDVKIDTGAFTSSLHCHEIEIENIKGTNFLKFKLLDPEHDEYKDKYIYTSDFDDTVVKSSNGIEEHRYTIFTSIKLYNKKYKNVEFSLTDRGQMKYPILIGRKFLKNKFIVDVSEKNLSYNIKQK